MQDRVFAADDNWERDPHDGLALPELLQNPLECLLDDLLVAGDLFLVHEVHESITFLAAPIVMEGVMAEFLCGFLSNKQVDRSSTYFRSHQCSTPDRTRAWTG